MLQQQGAGSRLVARPFPQHLGEATVGIDRQIALARFDHDVPDAPPDDVIGLKAVRHRTAVR
ncbi:hypothetical protein [Microbispora rosea]|uniref:hypothetical protein n=1 Tax=Microbispora rosea TaxID=58117 RepID=UPI0009712A55|nr:hypothetical protein [Microbispora rosea]GIH51978.1 hypothetical protein Mro03_71570 [Microbispora rosea subsp. rosea]